MGSLTGAPQAPQAEGAVAAEESAHDYEGRSKAEAAGGDVDA